MKIYNYDHATGAFIGQGVADQDQMDPGNWLIPAFAVDKAPPDAPEGQWAFFDAVLGEWVLRAILKAAEPELPPGPTQADIDAARQTAYQRLADPMFFKWQRGEATKEDWLAVIEQIKTNIPNLAPAAS